MTITSAKYYTHEIGSRQSIKATIDGEEVWVPCVSGNRHYDEIMRQVAAGTLTIADAD